MKRILLVAPYGGVPGGITRWTEHIVEHYNQLPKKDLDIDLVPTGRSMFVNINMSLFRKLRYAWIDYRKILANYSKTLKSRQYDIVHLTSSGTIGLFKDLYMLRKAKRRGVKTIVHFHFGRIPELSEKKNWEWKMLMKVCRTVDRIIVLDRASYDTLTSIGFTNVDILPNPVAPKVEEVVKSTPKEINRGEILFVGHVVKTKGVFELIDAFKGLNLDVNLKLLGHITPEMTDKILDRLTSEEKQLIEICGEKPYEAVIKDILKCDLFVLPTYTEGFPNVILEAMATGCAIISTPVGAIPQILERGDDGREYGLLVPARDSESLREAIRLLINDEKRKEKMRHNAAERVMERYSIESIWSQIYTVWTCCL